MLILLHPIYISTILVEGAHRREALIQRLATPEMLTFERGACLDVQGARRPCAVNPPLHRMNEYAIPSTDRLVWQQADDSLS